MSPFLKYTVLRLGLFVLALGVLAVLGARGWLLLLLAAVASLALSFVLLGRVRDEMTAQLARRGERPKPGRLGRRLAEDEAAEDREAGAADDPGSTARGG
ncbi:MAG: DUF4229 domain-containing protein [Actinomycetota bacterium]